VFIGVDLGGTNVRAAAVYEDGSFAGERVENPSLGTSGAEATIEAVGRTILQAVAASECWPEAAGIAIPGTVNDETGVVRWSPNLGKTEDGVFHYWTDIPFRAMLSRHVDMPTLLGNDANLAALGEYQFGHGPRIRELSGYVHPMHGHRQRRDPLSEGCAGRRPRTADARRG